MWHSTQERYRHTTGIWLWCTVFLVRLSACSFLGLFSLRVPWGVNPWDLQFPFLSCFIMGTQRSPEIPSCDHGTGELALTLWDFFALFSQQQ